MEHKIPEPAMGPCTSPAPPTLLTVLIQPRWQTAAAAAQSDRASLKKGPLIRVIYPVDVHKASLKPALDPRTALVYGSLRTNVSAKWTWSHVRRNVTVFERKRCLCLWCCLCINKSDETSLMICSSRQDELHTTWSHTENVTKIHENLKSLQ